MSVDPALISRGAAVAFAIATTVCALLLGPVGALAAKHPTTNSGKGMPRAPNGPVLGLGGVLGSEASSSAPSSGGDPLAGNGLDSPLCRVPSGLSAAQRRSCETDSFVAAPDPTNDYAFDVNINTGVSKWGNDMSATLDNFAQYGWMALVSATHGLVVMFEWCYSLNLLSGALLSQVTGALHNARLTFTEPWLAIVLAVASIMVVYHGLVRRQVAETIAQALAMLAMMAGGLWVMADPAGTVGAVEQWTDQAGLGTMAAAASGTPGHAERTLADNMQVIFSSVVTTPWCYLEFGDVEWCDGTDRLDGALRNAGLKIAKGEEAKSGCQRSCPSSAPAGTRTLFASAALLREAQSNGELFLALPANESERNSVTKAGTLLNVLCGGGKSADECQGPTAPQAEFRSQKGTGSRVIGLFAIWLGALGMLLLLGYLALRLLGAALVGLFFLLLAPAAVLAPALGDGGRSAFRSWALKLLEAVVAKLTYSFLLGVVLMMMKLLLSLTILGWWEQWLLISAFWWGIFLKRHQTLGWATGAGHGRGKPEHRSPARHVGEKLKARHAERRDQQPAPEVKPASKSARKPLSGVRSGAGRDSSSAPDAGPAGGNIGLGEEGKVAGALRSGRSGAGNSVAGNEDGAGNGSYTGKSAKKRPEVAVQGEGAVGLADESGRGIEAGSRTGGSLPGKHRPKVERSDAQLALAQATPSGGASPMAHGMRLQRIRRERGKALASGDTRRAIKLGVREQRIEGRQANRQTLAIAMVDPEVDAVEIAEFASLARLGGSAPQRSAAQGSIAQGSVAQGSVAQPSRPSAARARAAPTATGARSEAQSRHGHNRPGGELSEQRSSVMDDAREVAARRKRQLGWGSQPSAQGGTK